jgi:transposase InsO family protein
MGGKFVTKRKALIDFTFPELSTQKIVSCTCHVDDKTNPEHALYDMIIGMDLMTDLGLYVNTATKQVVWENDEVRHESPLRQRGELHNRKELHGAYNMYQETEVLKEAEERHGRILDADYSKQDLKEFVKELDQLTDEEKSLLLRTLTKHEDVFQGGLGRLNIKPIHLELKPDSQPYHARAFPVPQKLERTTKKEMDRLTDIGVFKKSHNSEWAAPTFVQPKKTGDVRILTDFRKLNACLKRKPFPLPKISDLLQRLTGFRYATAIDLSMGYYHIPLDKESQALCTTILPWGKYQYQRLPMGVASSPDIFQAIMSDLLGDLEFARTYLDDILIVSDGTFEDHMSKLEAVLKRLEAAGFRANVRKCYFAKDEVEYLGYQLTRNGIQPQPKKVEAILRIAPPKTKKQLRHFLGMVNFYRDVWRRRSHILAPLTSMVSKTAKWIWGPEQQNAFEEMKRIMSKHTLLNYPDFNKTFHIYTDASDFQLGGVIMQDDKPLAFYSRKLNNAQKNYTTGEQELLSIVETLKEFRNILFGQKIVVHTDHMNIVYGKLGDNQRIVRWRLLLEEFGPEYVHIAGKDNVVADALSRLEADFEDGSESEAKNTDNHILCAVAMANVEIDDYTPIPDARDNHEMAHAFGETAEEEIFPLHPKLIAREQSKCKELQTLVMKGKDAYEYKIIEDASLLHHNGKILIPKSLRERIVAWYHTYLVHPGTTRLEATLRSTLTWPNLRRDVERHTKTCRECQLCKKQRKKYGKLPTKQAEPSIPWNRINIDMVGPLTVKTPKRKHKLRVLTMIDPATGWFEVAQLKDATAKGCEEAFDNTWLARYPRPQYIGFDNGNEYKATFKELCNNMGLKPKRSTEYNPQSNGIVERVHQVLADMLRTFELEKRELDKHDPWSEFLTAVGYAIRSTYHTTLEASPAQLVFGRDMMLPVTINADWTRIQQQRQKAMIRNNERENKSRIDHTYERNSLVLLDKPGILRKMSTPRSGPYKIVQVYTNGTIRIKRGRVSERVSIRRVTPYFKQAPSSGLG